MSESKPDLARVFRITFRPSDDGKLLECFLQFKPERQLQEEPPPDIMLGSVNFGLLAVDEFVQERFTELMKNAAMKLIEDVGGLKVAAVRLSQVDADGNEVPL